DLDAGAVDAMVTAAGANARSPLLSVEIRHLGGALAEARPGNGALASLDAKFVLFAIGATPTPESRTAVELHVAAVKRAFTPWDAGRVYLHFAQSWPSGDSVWGAEAHARLQRVKAKWDSGNVFRAD